MNARPMKSRQPTAAHVAAMDDLKGVLGKHPNLSAMEMLALASQLVGNLIALQDQRVITPGMAMELVAQNIDIGNQTVIDGLLNTKGSA